MGSEMCIRDRCTIIFNLSKLVILVFFISGGDQSDFSLVKSVFRFQVERFFLVGKPKAEML